MRQKFSIEVDRWALNFDSNLFLQAVWKDFDTSIQFALFLTTRDFHRFCCSCAVLFCDHSETSFVLTERRFGLLWNDTWEVPTPPVAPYSVTDIEEQD